MKYFQCFFSYSFAIKNSRNGEKWIFCVFLRLTWWDLVGSDVKHKLLIIFLWPRWCPRNVKQRVEIMNRRRPSTLFSFKTNAFNTSSIRYIFSCFIFFLQRFRSMMTFWLFTRLNPCIRSFSRVFFFSVPSLDATAKPRNIYTQKKNFSVVRLCCRYTHKQTKMLHQHDDVNGMDLFKVHSTNVSYRKVLRERDVLRFVLFEVEWSGSQL